MQDNGVSPQIKKIVTIETEDNTSSRTFICISCYRSFIPGNGSYNSSGSRPTQTIICNFCQDLLSKSLSRKRDQNFGW